MLAILPRVSVAFSIKSRLLYSDTYGSIRSQLVPPFLSLNSAWSTVAGGGGGLSSCSSLCLERSFLWLSHTCLFIHSALMLNSQEALAWPLQNQSADDFWTHYQVFLPSPCLPSEGILVPIFVFLFFSVLTPAHRLLREEACVSYFPLHPRSSEPRMTHGGDKPSNPWKTIYSKLILL